MATSDSKEIINLTIDGVAVRVPKGTNLIEAARSVGIEIPHYCYHPHLAVAGNCRMCQVKIKGAPRLDIACNTQVREGMEVSTHRTSREVADAQAAILEFILINHPLDCTVCDQSGHCKLQDYHFEYNARPSRFVEEKVHKVKAEVLGPNVILDGERCIMCTRCIRFCDEVTKTRELGMLNRGDRSVIAISPGRPLDNALSGTVVDLCPVGALTHRTWRFNTRIWFTKETDSICPGCSTGCNCRVAVRDGRVVMVKARLNSAVNREWMCDEGRYGFHRFLPEARFADQLVDGKACELGFALARALEALDDGTLVFVAPDLMLEEYEILKQLLAALAPRATVVMAYRERELSDVERILISPDYAANFRAAQFVGLAGQDLKARYEDALAQLRAGQCRKVIFVGERSVLREDLDSTAVTALSGVEQSLAMICDRSSPLASVCRMVLPGRSILEKSGMLLNRAGRLQYHERVIDFPQGTHPEWRLMARLAELKGLSLSQARTDRDLTLEILRASDRLTGVTIATLKSGGLSLC